MRVILILAMMVAVPFHFLTPLDSVAAPGELAIGTRIGLSGPNKGESFREVDAYFLYELPWQWPWPAGWNLATLVDIAAGTIEGADKAAFIGSLAPGVTLTRLGSRFALLANVGMAFLSEHDFGQQAIGGPVQFVLYAGVNYRLTQNLRVSYRYRHMSNSALYRSNPGLEMHLFGMSYHF